MRTKFFVIAIGLFISANLKAQLPRDEDDKSPTTTEFLKKNSAGDSLQWKEYRYITLFLKNGEKVTYDLDMSSNREVFVKKYGTPPQQSYPSTGRVSRRESK
jgi:hypothetical protein